MIPINHILVLSQPEFVRKQLAEGLSGESLPSWWRRPAR
jgi:hypothetical protein